GETIANAPNKERCVADAEIVRYGTPHDRAVLTCISVERSQASSSTPLRPHASQRRQSSGAWRSTGEATAVDAGQRGSPGSSQGRRPRDVRAPSSSGARRPLIREAPSRRARSGLERGHVVTGNSRMKRGPAGRPALRPVQRPRPSTMSIPTPTHHVTTLKGRPSMQRHLFVLTALNLSFLFLACNAGPDTNLFDMPPRGLPTGGTVPETTPAPDAGSASPDAGTAAEPDPGPNEQVAGNGIFPPDNDWNTRIDDAPVDPRSDEYIASMGADQPLVASWDEAGHGLPYVEVDANQKKVPVSFWGHPKESDPGPYPIPW